MTSYWIVLSGLALVALAVAWIALRGGGLCREHSVRFVCPHLGSTVDCRILQDIRTGQWRQVRTCSAFTNPEEIVCDRKCHRIANLGFLSVGMAAVLAMCVAACAPTRKSSTGFHLPDGDPLRGRQAFVDLKCHACHRVKGVDLPAPVADPPVPVVLGGVVYNVRTDGELATAIIDPSHRTAPGYRLVEVRAGNLSRMGDFSEEMTVRQLVDLVAFLQSRYEVRSPPRAR